LDGDDLGSAKAAANRIRYATVAGNGERFYDQILRFVQAGKLILGVCNGFQLMVKLAFSRTLKGKKSLSRRQRLRPTIPGGLRIDGSIESQSGLSLRLHKGAQRGLPPRPARRGKIHSRDKMVQRALRERHLITLPVFGSSL